MPWTSGFSTYLAPDEEILTSFGPLYNYDFMDFPAVRAHFCRLMGEDCATNYTWEP